MKLKFILSLSFLATQLPMSVAMASGAEYRIASEFVSTDDFSACDLLSTYRTIKKKESEPNLSEAQKENINAGLAIVKDTTPPLNVALAANAATVAISVQLPSTLQLNRANFFLEGTDGLQIGTFSSDLLFNINGSDQVVTLGNGATSFKIDLSVAAFCRGYIEKGVAPSVESVVQGLFIK